MYEAYVIGTAPKEILYFMRDSAGFVREVLFDLPDLMPECIIWTFEEAEALLVDIQDNYEKLKICKLGGKELSVNDLHIYRLGTVKEVM